MESIIYGKPILHGVLTLKSLIANFKEYTKLPELSEDDEEQYEQTLQAIDLIKGSISQINSAKNDLQSLVEKMKSDYDTIKNKEDKKNILQELEKIEEEAKYTAVLNEATEMSLMLNTRLTEACSNERRLLRKLGKYVRSQSVQENSLVHPLTFENTTVEPASPEPDSLSGRIPPPRINLPKFYGNEQEFPEFWAAYETLVHNNRSLTIIEKMLLLKESLRGKSDRAIKGIQLLPQNYQWMIETLTKKYGNKPANRSRIVQRLRDLPTADRRAESNEQTYDKICVLLNHMLSAGQDIRATKDAMWSEAILSKFHRDIVEPVLVKMREKDDTTVENIMQMIEGEIAAKSYIQSRTQLSEPNKRAQETRYSRLQKCAICDKENHFAWQCTTPLTVAEKRKIVLRKRLCWKCYSDQHASKDCTRQNCTLCGKLHHNRLCFSNENASTSQFYARQSSIGSGCSSNGNDELRSSEHQQMQQRSSNSRTKNHGTNESHKQRPPWRRNQNMNLHIEGNQIEEQSQESDVIGSEIRSTVNHTAIKNPEEHSRYQIILMTAEGNVWNYNTERFEKAVFLFDTGAQKTIIEQEFAFKLGLPRLKTETCVMSGIGGNTEMFESNIVSLRVGTAYGKDLDLLIQTKPILTKGFPSVRLSPTDQAFLQERSILVCNPSVRGENQLPQILVGLDHYYDFVLEKGEILQIPSGLRLAGTIFGPTLYGRGIMKNDETNTSTPAITHCITAILSDEPENEMLTKLFELEGLGIGAENNGENHDLLSYLKRYSKQISFEGGFVTAPFPLKSNVNDLADNYSSAIKRLASLYHQLENNPEQKDWYIRIFRQYEADDIIEKAHERSPNSVGLYYMPHSGVWRPHKSKPLRIVFDASSNRKGELSLNDVTHKGESLVRKIHDILVASRASEIILTCDIEAAFTQIRLHETHKDLCRFLWLKNPNKPPSRENIVEYRFKRIPFGVKPSPSILNMSLLAFLKSKNSSLSQEILDNLYVDNILLSASTPAEAITKYKKSKALLSEIGMNLREYSANHAEVNEAIPCADRAPQGMSTILGVRYNKDSDQFCICLKFAKKDKLTKRDVVSQLNSIYDPIGIVGPITVRLKQLMREIYESGVGWKEPIPERLASKWNATCKDYENVSVALPRYIGMPGTPLTNVTLWVFADASEKALATCAYLRHEETNTVSTLISGKTRLAPKKTKQTIPKLEIVAILMAIRLAKSIVSAIRVKLNEVQLLSDSEIALAWIRSIRKLPLFVENQRDRILKIKSTLESESISVNFFHVRTEDNPADAGTRGVDASVINDLPWVRGPQWLRDEKFPPRLKKLADIGEQNLEQYVEIPEGHAINVQVACTHDTSETSLIALERFSRLDTALRTAARVGKVIHAWVNKVNRRRNSQSKLCLQNLQQFDDGYEITAKDVKLSETLLLQEAHSAISLNTLQRRFPQKKIFRDENGIIRNASRIQNAPVSYDVKNPIYLERDSEITRLIVTDIHIKNGHSGKDHTLCLARQRFWIPRPCGVFKKYLKNCVVCRKAHGLPFGAPEMPPLPKDRTVLTKPFQTVGCDFLGPFQSSENKKYYVSLYTCLTTRAVHLEVVEDMSTGAFLNSFIRFISRRGVPTIIRTDCGSNFKLGQQIIERICTPNERTGDSVMSYSSNRGIQWIFNPPGAPWMGGAWERLVGTVKRAFTKSIGRKKLSYSQLYTIMTQIEAIINTRPLTAASNDEDDIPLRPIDFMQRSLKYSLPEINKEELEDPTFDPNLIQTAAQAKQAIQQAELISSRFWDRWYTEYLTALREMQTVNRKQPRHGKLREPRVNEIVLVEQENLPRGTWCVGKIIDLVRGNDDHVRSVKLLMPNKHVWLRAVNKIYPLEISAKSVETPDVRPKEDQPSQEVHENERSHPRLAKLKAKKAITEMSKDPDEYHDPQRSTRNSQMNLFAIIMIVVSILGPSVEASPRISCSNRALHVSPPNGTFQLCVRSTCRYFVNSSSNLIFQLPPTARNGVLPVSLRYFSGENYKQIHENCILPQVCDVSQTLMSRHLLGNPHCWPTGALITIGTFAYLIVSAIALLAKCVLSRKESTQSGVADPSSMIRDDNESSSPENAIPRGAESVNIQLQSFRPLPLSRTSRSTALAVIVCAALLHNLGETCQQGFTRHNVDVVCTSGNACSIEFRREILFDKIHKMACIDIFHGNVSIGILYIEKLPLELECAKRTLFYTRDTSLKVYSTTRCALKGSCKQDACSTIKPDSMIEEFVNASRYPGYTGCEPSCGGLICGCLLPLPACSFYRIAHIPRNTDVYEIATCMEWKPLVQVKVQLNLHDMFMKRRVTLRPYVPQKIGDTSFTVISISSPSDQLLKSRFALSEHEALIVPEGNNMPVECNSPDEAKDHIARCKNKVICQCDADPAPARCYCPQSSIATIKSVISNILPVTSPFLKIVRRDMAIVAYSEREEMTLVVESKYMKESTGYIIKEDCNISISEITGCYSCQEGANLIVSCTTAVHTWNIIQCETHVFSIECDPLGKENVLTLDFQQAIVEQNCFAECNNRTVHLLLKGSLVYLPHMSDEEIFISNIATWNSTKWFQDWRMIDLAPMLRIVKNHWKASFVTLATVATFSAATYLFGPAILLVVLQLIAKGLKGFAKLGVSFVKAAFKAISKLTMSRIRATRRGSIASVRKARKIPS